MVWRVGMMRRGKFLAVLALSSLFLAGCSSEGTKTGLFKEITGSLSTAIKTRRAGRPPIVEMSAEQLATIDAAVLQINPKKNGGTNFLTRVSQRGDSRGNTVDIWQSSDNAQVILRRGVLVGTRGVGADIISSEASQTVNAITNIRPGRGTRRLQVSNGDSTTTDLQLNCAWTVIGQETITVVNQSFNTTHMRESCGDATTTRATIENHFWVQPGGTVRKSLQWAGPAVGYFEMFLLKG